MHHTLTKLHADLLILSQCVDIRIEYAKCEIAHLAGNINASNEHSMAVEDMAYQLGQIAVQAGKPAVPAMLVGYPWIAESFLKGAKKHQQSIDYGHALAAKSRVRAEAIREQDWASLKLPTPAALTEMLKRGEKFGMEGHSFCVDDHGLTLCNSYGQDSFYCWRDEINVEVVTQLMLDLLNEEEFGATPDPVSVQVSCRQGLTMARAHAAAGNWKELGAETPASLLSKLAAGERVMLRNGEAIWLADKALYTEDTLGMPYRVLLTVDEKNLTEVICHARAGYSLAFDLAHSGRHYSEPDPIAYIA